MFKTLTSFFRFYWYMIKRSPKRYDIAMDAIQGTATMVTPLFMFLGFVFISIIVNPILGMYFPLAIPIILGNMFVVHKVRDSGYDLQRRATNERREAERMQRAKEEARRRAKERAEWEADMERINREFDEILERLRQRRMYEERQRRQQQESHQERHYRQQQNIQNKNMENAMKLLGLSKGFTEKDVKKAYRRLSKIHHPDVGGLQANFVKLNKAYNYIMERI